MSVITPSALGLGITRTASPVALTLIRVALYQVTLDIAQDLLSGFTIAFATHSLDGFWDYLDCL